MSPENVSAAIRAAPLPISKVNRFAWPLPMPCSPGRSVIGKSLSSVPRHVDTDSCALAFDGMARRMSPECALSS